MNIAFLNGFHTGDKLHASGSSQKVANHRFGGINLHLVGVVAQSQLDGLGLKQVVVMGAGAVSVYIVDILRSGSRVFNRYFHGFGRTAAILRRGGNVVGVAGRAVSHQLRQDFGSSGFGVLQGLQDYNTGTLSHDKTVSLLIKRNRCS